MRRYSNVIFKKRNGILVIGDKDLSWSLVGSENNPFLSIKYEEMEEPVINPRTSEKGAMIKLSLMANSKMTPMFTFIDGFDVRDQVKDEIIAKITEFKNGGIGGNSSGNSSGDFDPYYCSVLLASDPGLYEMYQKLVVAPGAPLTEKDFWEPRKHLLQDVKFKAKLEKEESLASSVLADLRPEGMTSSSSSSKSSKSNHSKDANGIKLILTPSLITAVFKLYPSVEKAYRQLVPQKMSETEFWTLYGRLKFLSHGSNVTEDIFPEIQDRQAVSMLEQCLDAEERAFALLLHEKRHKVNALVDLWSSDQENPQMQMQSEAEQQSHGQGQEDTRSSKVRNLNRVSQMLVQLSSGSKEDTRAVVNWTNQVILDDLKCQKPMSFIKLPENIKTVATTDPATATDTKDPTPSSSALHKKRKFLDRLEKKDQEQEADLIYNLSDFNASTIFHHNSSMESSRYNPDDSDPNVVSFYRKAREILCHYWSCRDDPRQQDKRIRMGSCLEQLDQEASTLIPNQIKTWKECLRKIE